jgi:hypothetical protein
MRSVTSVAFPPATPAGKAPGDVYVAASRALFLEDLTPVPASIGRLFRTEDRGASFAALHGNGTGADLPNVPIHSVLYDHGDAAGLTLYAGTEIGVYATHDGGATWERFGDGLPFVRVTDMFLSRNSDLLRISTFGRGIWEVNPAAAAPRGVAGDGDVDHNGQIDAVDLAAMAARLGSSPSTSGAPGYLWYSDVTGATPSIDDADLSALLGKLGGRP